MTRQEAILEKIKIERIRQDKLWGEQNHSPNDWVVILTEELGEIAKAAWERKPINYLDELIQIAAVAVAAFECVDRGKVNEW